jgi:hypothetical protein
MLKIIYKTWVVPLMSITISKHVVVIELDGTETIYRDSSLVVCDDHEPRDENRKYRRDQFPNEPINSVLITQNNGKVEEVVVRRFINVPLDIVYEKNTYKG